jgi:hypothetical protein
VGPSDSGATYGEFVESYCPGGKWGQFSSGGDSFVNYTGGDSPEGGVDIQWVKNSSGWAVYAVEINGEGVSLAHINTFFSSASDAAAAAEPAEEPESTPPAAEAESTPAEPYITTDELNSLTDENSPHYAKVINAHDAEVKGKVNHVIQNPNTKNTDLISIDLNPGVTANVSKYEAYKGVGSEPLDVPGTVIKLGKQKLEQGDLDAGSPDTTIYVFDGKVTPAQFAAATQIYWNPFMNRYDAYRSEYFDYGFLESKSQPGQYHGVAAGEAETVGMSIPKGVNVGDVLQEHNSAIEIDMKKFNDKVGDWHKKYGGAFPVGSTFIHKNMGGKTVFFIEEHTDDDNYSTVQLPNSNNTGFHDMYNQAALDTNLSIAKTDSGDEYTLITPGEGITTPGENAE